MTAICHDQAPALLGESALWVPERQRLFWLDLNAPALRCFDPVKQSDEIWTLPLPTPLGGIVRLRNGLLLATREGLMRCDIDNRRLELWIQPNARPDDTTFNDGKVDRHGRLWLGTKHLEEREPTGQLYRVSPDGESAVVDGGFVCSNGPAFSPDGCTLYFADTTERRILAYDLGAAGGELTRRRVFATFTPEEGEPDGMTTDTQGGLWVCHWGGGRVTRFTSEGERDSVVALPVPNVTSCCFGGSDLRTLFITTASVDMPAGWAGKAPCAGKLFSVEAEHTGLPEPVFELPSA